MPPLPARPSLTLTAERVERFAQASHDSNPLHTSADYARSTPFGTPVAHGMLALLASAGHLPDRPGMRLAQLTVDFKSPVFEGTSYALTVADDGTRSTIRLQDGQRLLLKATLTFAAGRPSAAPPCSASRPRTTAARRTLDELAPGWETRGTYAPDSAPLEALLRDLNVRPETGIGPAEAAVVLGASYLVGMEAPGESALFSRAVIQFHEAPASAAALDYHLRVVERDSRFAVLHTAATFTQEGHPFAEAAVEAFVRPPAATVNVTHLRTLSPPGRALEQKTAIVVGGSRGLGAAIAVALADQGARVGLCFAKSRAAAESVATLAAPGSIELLQADAENAEAFGAAAESFSGSSGGLDILVCNACPPLRALTLGGASATRFVDYVARAVAMAVIPLSCTLPRLATSSGAAVLVSSAAVTAPPRDWPHYIAAKAAVEALAGVIRNTAPKVRPLIVRPPQLRTDFVSSLGELGDALAPEVVAARIVRELISSSAPGDAILDTF